MLVASAVVAGAAATSMSVSGLDLNADERYIVEIEIIGVSGAPAIAITYNADTTAGNYWVQAFETNNTSSGGSRANTSSIFGTITLDTTSIDGDIRYTAEGRPRMMFEYASGDLSATKKGHGVHTWNTIGTNVTGMTVTATVANSMGIGSSVKVYRKH